jgi:hypothetical protein
LLLPACQAATSSGSQFEMRCARIIDIPHVTIDDRDDAKQESSKPTYE